MRKAAQVCRLLLLCGHCSCINLCATLGNRQALTLKVGNDLAAGSINHHMSLCVHAMQNVVCRQSSVTQIAVFGLIHNSRLPKTGSVPCSHRKTLMTAYHVDKGITGQSSHKHLIQGMFLQQCLAQQCQRTQRRQCPHLWGGSSNTVIVGGSREGCD